MLELIEFQPNSGQIIRAGAQNWDYGIYNIGFEVHNLDAIYRKITAQGFSSLSTPITYQPFGKTVKEVLIIGPDKVPLVHLDRMNIPSSKPTYVKLNSSLIIVEDIAPVMAFYRDILGLEVLRTERVSRGSIDTILAPPEGTEGDLAFIRGSDQDTFLLLFMQLSVKGRSLAAVARPPNLGVFMISLEVSNLQDLIDKLSMKGIPMESELIKLHTNRLGAITAMSLRCPGSIWVELYQRTI